MIAESRKLEHALKSFAAKMGYYCFATQPLGCNVFSLQLSKWGLITTLVCVQVSVWHAFAEPAVDGRVRVCALAVQAVATSLPN